MKPNIFKWLPTLATMFALQAGAQTYSNQLQLNGVGAGWVGATGFQNFGQVFTIEEELQLKNWTFYPLNGDKGNIKLFISTWSPQQTAGALVYESTPIKYSGPYYGELHFPTINTSLIAGTYIAYLSVANVPDPASSISIQTTAFNGGLEGGFRFNSNYDPHRPEIYQNIWHSSQGQVSLGYKATFSAPAMPVDESMPIVLTISGLSVLLLAKRKAIITN